jgi:large conductance mechanosensitive channel
MSIIKDFKQFAMRGNLIDMAVGFTVGAAFTTIAKSLVDDIVMPVIGVLIGKADFSNFFIVLRDGTKALPPYTTAAEAHAAGAVTVNYGTFINNIIAFLLVTMSMFVLLKTIKTAEERLSNTLGKEKPKEEEPANKNCTYCLSTIAFRATRCPQCTSQLEEPLAAGAK